MDISLILLFIASAVNAQDIIYEEEQDDRCKLADGGNGICKESRLCPEAYANFPSERPVICGFVGRNPIICCAVKIDRVTQQPDIVPILDISPPEVDFICGNSRPTLVLTRPGTPESRSVPRNRVSRAPIDTSSDPAGLSSNAGTAVSKTFPEIGLDERPGRDDLNVVAAVGGERARFVLAKYSAIVGSRDASGNPDWFCTGVLLNHRWVLTAAHCIVQRTVNIVRLGEHDYNDPNDGARPIDYEVSDTIPHPEFTHPQGYHDLALLKLSSHVVFGKFINPVCLPWGAASDQDLTHQKISLTGWGATQFGGFGSSVLQEVNVTVFPNFVCERSYSDLRDYEQVWPEGLKENILCAGDPQGGKDACQGDSGGPVVFLNPDFQYVLAGVVSRGYGCGLKDFPGLYANMLHPPYLAWIKELAFQ